MPNENCTRTCWMAGAGFGLLVWIFSGAIGTAGLIGGLFLGIIGGVLLAFFLRWALCEGQQAMDGTHWHPGSHPTASSDPTTSPRPRGSDSAAATGFVGSAEAPRVASQPDVAPSGHAQPSESGSRPEAKRADIYAGATPEAGTSAEPQAEEQPAASHEGPDDLKQIKGVGPKLEETLHENGVTTFAQIAAWDDAEIDRFAELIGRMGSRIRSDDWVEQARVLTSGNETEFSARVEKGDVY